MLTTSLKVRHPCFNVIFPCGGDLNFLHSDLRLAGYGLFLGRLVTTTCLGPSFRTIDTAQATRPGLEHLTYMFGSFFDTTMLI